MGGSWTKVELIQGKTIVEGQLNNMHTSMIGSISGPSVYMECMKVSEQHWCI